MWILVIALVVGGKLKRLKFKGGSMQTENVYNARIEELETALENLLECFERGTGRPWIEVEVDVDGSLSDEGDLVKDLSCYITVGQVNQHTADAVEFAEKVLWAEGRTFDAEDEV